MALEMSIACVPAESGLLAGVVGATVVGTAVVAATVVGAAVVATAAVVPVAAVVAAAEVVARAVVTPAAGVTVPTLLAWPVGVGLLLGGRTTSKIIAAMTPTSKTPTTAAITGTDD